MASVLHMSQLDFPSSLLSANRSFRGQICPCFTSSSVARSADHSTDPRPCTIPSASGRTLAAISRMFGAALTRWQQPCTSTERPRPQFSHILVIDVSTRWPFKPECALSWIWAWNWVRLSQQFRHLKVDHLILAHNWHVVGIRAARILSATRVCYRQVGARGVVLLIVRVLPRRVVPCHMRRPNRSSCGLLYSPPRVQCQTSIQKSGYDRESDGDGRRGRCCRIALTGHKCPDAGNEAKSRAGS
jgi:hypothetical protein